MCNVQRTRKCDGYRETEENKSLDNVNNERRNFEKIREIKI